MLLKCLSFYTQRFELVGILCFYQVCFLVHKVIIEKRKLYSFLQSTIIFGYLHETEKICSPEDTANSLVKQHTVFYSELVLYLEKCFLKAWI